MGHDFDRCISTSTKAEYVFTGLHMVRVYTAEKGGEGLFWEDYVCSQHIFHVVPVTLASYRHNIIYGPELEFNW